MRPKDIVRGMSSKPTDVRGKVDIFNDDGHVEEHHCYTDERSSRTFDMGMNSDNNEEDAITGEFIDFDGDRFYVIRNVDKMAPFFISVVSDSDHWLFLTSLGGLTAGRVSPDTALFPYVTVDKIHDSAVHTGCKTIFQVDMGGKHYEWEPFNMEHDGLYDTSRQLYKNLLGNKICFEEINHNLQLVFRYTWATSDEFGFIRNCEIRNLGDHCVSVDMVDGLQNILPADTPRFVQTNSSNLVDAYKWTELDEKSGIALFTLYSGISDRAEPCESLKANVVYCLGITGHKILISSEQLDNFRLGYELGQETRKRGIRGAYLINKVLVLEPGKVQKWQFSANIQQTQAQVVRLRSRLANPAAIAGAIERSIKDGSDNLFRIMACADGFQQTAEENVSVHHYANVLFNVMRGGIFDDQYMVSSKDFSLNIKNFNVELYRQYHKLLTGLPDKLDYTELLLLIKEQDDPQLERLCLEYLPITFGRRHGDPSRPWNQFAIKLKDDQGERLLSYEGNWRDIFQNWEALALSYPEFIENMIAKFVNASTVDGYNPYRITKQGIDWEVEEPDDPWSYIGYWGDHQIIYLLKLLEISNNYHPSRLCKLLHKRVYSYANVPYRIKPFSAILKDAKHTVVFDVDLAQRIERKVELTGADGKLVLDRDGKVYQVNLLEKLLVPLLSKLGNLVVDGGIWLNTQRPEWNDANNALVGQGLSMVTLYYTRRYVNFFIRLLQDVSGRVVLSTEVAVWLTDTAEILKGVLPTLDEKPLDNAQRYRILNDLGEAAGKYREAIYKKGVFSGTSDKSVDLIKSLLDDALFLIDHSIVNNERDDGLYHAYNLLRVKDDELTIGALYPMLEGQVAVLSSGAISPEHAVSVIEALFSSKVYRSDQKTFMLYPDRELPGFFDKNLVPEGRVTDVPLLLEMIEADDDAIILRDDDGNYRFNADLVNLAALTLRLDELIDKYPGLVDAARRPLQELYEVVFNHQSFTGRSGGMFGFEGLGCVYWHMVSKLLLAVQENYIAAVDAESSVEICNRLGRLYYQIRDGIGFNKSPSQYGAFPTDPYSHTPKHAGAQQPGMTGQVKEEILTRFGELGLRVKDGSVFLQPDLLRESEFTSERSMFTYISVDGDRQAIAVPARGLAFSWCQVPFIYQIDESTGPSITLNWDDGTTQSFTSMRLPENVSSELFRRSGRIIKISVTLSADQLFST